MFEHLTGISNLTPTPFKPDGSLDEPIDTLSDLDDILLRLSLLTAKV